MSVLKSIRAALVLSFLLLVGSISAQTTVKGTVKDATGEAVIGATVTEQGTKNAAVTDFDGNFTIKVAGNKPLVISYIGMKTKTVDVKGKSTVSVTMEDDSNTLNELVVIGYGAVRKKDLTGSVATVSSDALQAVPVASATEALTGKMAGVQITTTEGSPDAEMKIRVRGGGSITQSNEPLFIVDGFPVSSISDIPASDIEDITVLKDASSTAIYGSRGANGVILVTTKSGQAGKVKVSYNAYISVKSMASKLKTLGTRDYLNWQWELAMLNDSESQYTKMFGNYQDMDIYDTAQTNDWQDVVFGRTGHTFNHNLSVTGGSENTTYSFNYAHVGDKGIMLNSNFRRDNLSLKLKHKIGKTITLDFSARYANTSVKGAGANESKQEVSTADSRMKDVIIYPMLMMSDLSDGYDEELNLTPPLVSTRDNDRYQKRQTFDLNGAFTWEIFKNFKFKTEFGLQHYYNNDRRYYGVSTYNSRVNGNNLPMANFVDETRKTFRNTNTISYDFKGIIKNKDHSLNVMFGQELIKKKSDANTIKMFNYPELFTAQDTWNLSSQGQALVSPDYFIYANDNLFSFFGRANYNYKDKYLVSATFRTDGSSKFSDGNRWGFFPSAAVAWRISSEPWMEKTQKWLDDLKLRFSFGTAGNNGIPSDRTRMVWSSASTSWLNGNPSLWTTGSVMPNPDLTWETTITRNIGLDFTMFGSKLSGSVEFYWNTTKDLLIEFPVTGTGYNTQFRNLGKTENKGVEITLNWTAINKKNWGLSFSGNIGFNKNKVKDLGGLPQISAASGWASTQIGSEYIVKVGHPIGEIYGYVNGGRYEASDFEDYEAAGNKWVLREGIADASNIIGAKYMRPGAMKIESTTQHWDAEQNAWVWNSTGLPQNEEGEIANGKVSSSDIVKIGDTNPTANGGFAINARAYGFDFAANFTFSLGNDVYNADKIEYTTAGQRKYRNMIDLMAAGSRWNNIDADGNLVNDIATLEAMNATTTMWSPYMTQNILTDWAIESGSFLRLATLTLGYTLPQKFIKKLRLSNLRFYFSCYNVFCWTKYTGSDPEVSTRNKTSLTPGVDYSAYPKSRQFVFGLNLNF